MSYRKRGSSRYTLHSARSMPSGSAKGLHGKGQDKYPGISKNVNFHRSDKITAEMAFGSRSKRSQALDLVKMAEIAPNIEAYLKSPNRFDWPCVDTADARLIFSHKSKRSQAADLARAAKRKVPLEIWIKSSEHTDLQGVDTKNAKPGQKRVTKQRLRKWKIVPKKKADKAKKSKLEKQKALDHEFLNGKVSKEEYERKRTMPNKKEIVEKAQEIHMEQLAKEGLPTVTATEQELKENGTFETARANLMRGETSKADSQMLQYISDLRTELEPYGFDIVEREQ